MLVKRRVWSVLIVALGLAVGLAGGTLWGACEWGCKGVTCATTSEGQCVDFPNAAPFGVHLDLWLTMGNNDHRALIGPTTDMRTCDRCIPRCPGQNPSDTINGSCGSCRLYGYIDIGTCTSSSS